MASGNQGCEYQDGLIAEARLFAEARTGLIDRMPW